MPAYSVFLNTVFFNTTFMWIWTFTGGTCSLDNKIETKSLSAVLERILKIIEKVWGTGRRNLLYLKKFVIFVKADDYLIGDMSKMIPTLAS
jgi:hypothetical protein